MWRGMERTAHDPETDAYGCGDDEYGRTLKEERRASGGVPVAPF